MPFPVLVDQGTPTQGTSSNCVLPKPAITAGNGGLLVAYIVQNSTSSAVTAPTGWVLIHSAVDVSNSGRLYAYYKVETGSEASSFTWANTTGGWIGWIDRVVDFDPSDPINVDATSSPASSLTFNVPRPTTTTNDCLVYQVLSAGAFAKTIAGFPANYPDNQTSFAKLDGTYRNGRATANQAGAGQAPAGTWTVASSQSSRAVLSAIAINYGATPFAPGTLTEVSHSGSSLQLAWTDSAGGAGTVTTQLQRSPAGEDTWSDLPGATSSPFSDTTVDADASYGYRVAYTDSEDPENPLYSNVLTLIAADDPSSVINETWLADNAAAFGGPPYLLGSSFSNGGRTHAVPTGKGYRLAADVTTDGTAFVAVDSGVSLGLNDYTITYDNAGAPIDINGGFEAEHPTLGAAFPDKWDLSNAPSCQRVARTVIGFEGDWMLRASGLTGTEYILSDPIAIPEKPCRYMAWVLPKGSSSITSVVKIVEAGNESNELGVGVPAGVASGYTSQAIYDCDASGVDAVRVKVEFSGAGTINLDFAGFAKSDVWGVVSTDSATNVPPQLSANPNIGTVPIARGGLMTVTGPGAIVQSGKSVRSHAFYGYSARNTLTGPMTIGTKGMESSCVFASYGSGEYTGLSMSQDYDAVPRRMSFYACVNLQNASSAGVVVDGCSVSGRGHIGIAVASSGDRIANVAITNNTLDWYSLGTDGYGIALNGVENCVVSGNTITPSNGRGILLDSFSNNGSVGVTIEGNNVSVMERANIEYGRTGMETTALRVRSFGTHHDIKILNNVFESKTDIGGSGLTDQWNYAAYAARISGSDGVSAPYYAVRGNTFRAIVLRKDPALTDVGRTSTAVALIPGSTGAAPQEVASIYENNILESNHIGLMVGDIDSYESAVGPQVFVGTIFRKSSLGDQTMTYRPLKIGDWRTVCQDLQIYSSTYEGGGGESVYWSSETGAIIAGQQVRFGDRLTVSVTNDGIPAPDADVLVQNALLETVHAGTTDADGLDAGILAGRQTLTWDGTSASAAVLTPLTVTATYGGDRQTVATPLAGDTVVAFSFGSSDAVSTYTLSGPSGGAVGAASGDFTLTLGPGTLAGAVRITPSDGGGGGAFSPGFLDLTDSARSGTFTYTPASAGTKTISAANDQSLTDPASLGYAVTSAPAGAILVLGVGSGVLVLRAG